ncbi:MAG TPA: hypothetical protein VFY84_12320, partial [Jiangellales bacterium]|nr:hypothetical protein [Jiangellales bacterium]
PMPPRSAHRCIAELVGEGVRGRSPSLALTYLSDTAVHLAGVARDRPVAADGPPRRDRGGRRTGRVALRVRRRPAAGYVRQARGTASRVAGTPDLAATTVDEHRDGLDRSRATHGDADLDALRATQAERLSRTFPR